MTRKKKESIRVKHGVKQELQVSNSEFQENKT